jgi:hypothetical protein
MPSFPHSEKKKNTRLAGLFTSQLPQTNKADHGPESVALFAGHILTVQAYALAVPLQTCFCGNFFELHTSIMSCLNLPSTRFFMLSV